MSNEKGSPCATEPRFSDEKGNFWTLPELLKDLDVGSYLYLTPKMGADLAAIIRKAITNNASVAQSERPLIKREDGETSDSPRCTPSNEVLLAMMDAWNNTFGSPLTRYAAMYRIAVDHAQPSHEATTAEGPVATITPVSNAGATVSNATEQVAKYITSIQDVMGSGDDPVGFLIASHAMLRQELREAERELSARSSIAPTEVRDALKSIDDLRGCILEEQKQGDLPVPFGMFLDALYRDTGNLADLIRRLSSPSATVPTLPIEVVGLLNTAASHLKTWVLIHERGSMDTRPYANTLDVANRLEAFVKGVTSDGGAA